jgi:hypothetical protein
VVEDPKYYQQVYFPQLDIAISNFDAKSKFIKAFKLIMPCFTEANA